MNQKQILKRIASAMIALLGTSVQLLIMPFEARSCDTSYVYS